jgi:flagellar biosynthesis chaperone FliJ
MSKGRASVDWRGWRARAVTRPAPTRPIRPPDREDPAPQGLSAARERAVAWMVEANVEPKTRLDKLVQVRERGEDVALENLAHAQSSLLRANERLAGVRQEARSDARRRDSSELWIVEEAAHVRALHDVRSAERDLAQAMTGEQQARAGYSSAHRQAEVARRAQEKKRTELKTERERREQKAQDEVATLRFNVRAALP